MTSSYDGDGGPVDNASQFAEPASPQHDKAKEYAKEMQAIGQFIEWMSTKGLVICERYWTGEHNWTGERVMALAPANVMGRIQQLLAEFYEIDYKAYLAEKDAALEYIRARNNIT